MNDVAFVETAARAAIPTWKVVLFVGSQLVILMGYFLTGWELWRRRGTGSMFAGPALIMGGGISPPATPLDEVIRLANEPPMRMCEDRL